MSLAVLPGCLNTPESRATLLTLAQPAATDSNMAAGRTDVPHFALGI